MEIQVEYGKRENEKERIVWAIGTVDGQEVHEVNKLPRSFSFTEVADDLAEHLWWITSEELKERLAV